MFQDFFYPVTTVNYYTERKTNKNKQKYVEASYLTAQTLLVFSQVEVKIRPLLHLFLCAGITKAF